MKQYLAKLEPCYITSNNSYVFINEQILTKTIHIGFVTESSIQSILQSFNRVICYIISLIDA